MATVAPPRMARLPYRPAPKPALPRIAEKQLAPRQIGYTTGSLNMGEKVIIRKPEGITSTTLDNLGDGDYRVSFHQRASDGSTRRVAECIFSSPVGCEKQISRHLVMPSRDLVFMFCYDDESPAEEVEDDLSEEELHDAFTALPKRSGCCQFR